MRMKMATGKEHFLNLGLGFNDSIHLSYLYYLFGLSNQDNGEVSTYYCLPQNRRRLSIDGDEIEIANKLVGLATRAASNNVVIDVFLVTPFAALCARSVNQQNNIEIPEAEEESLIKANKAMIKTM
ncbi:hypothetical protein SLEP1_g45685 [Rubroshorea leprosula]|uniref:Uncharacterized protein n=1 Tax=Rubroshorea leprosula TaxID=152421 RepID=A0AAV5LM48_9ROSI|nr:hypothetical protein SLEP1_g45685 [Rubroshorea leprosula]